MQNSGKMRMKSFDAEASKDKCGNKNERPKLRQEDQEVRASKEIRKRILLQF